MIPRSHPAGHAREPLRAVDIARRPVAQQVARRIVTRADDLVGGVIGAPAVGAVACQVIAEAALAHAVECHPRQPVDAIVGIDEHALQRPRQRCRRRGRRRRCTGGRPTGCQGARRRGGGGRRGCCHGRRSADRRAQIGHQPVVKAHSDRRVGRAASVLHGGRAATQPILAWHGAHRLAAQGLAQRSQELARHALQLVCGLCRHSQHGLRYGANGGAVGVVAGMPSTAAAWASTAASNSCIASDRVQSVWRVMGMPFLVGSATPRIHPPVSQLGYVKSTEPMVHLRDSTSGCDSCSGFHPFPLHFVHRIQEKHTYRYATEHPTQEPERATHSPHRFRHRNI